MNTPAKTRFLGLTISREVNILALFAFVLSICSLGWQGILLLRGADLVVFPDESVNVILTSPEGSGVAEEKLQVLFNTHISTVNEGAPGYDDTVSKMQLHLTLRQDGEVREVTYPALNFEEFVPGPNGYPVIKTTEGAHQFVVAGQGHVGQHVSFAGRVQLGPSDLSHRAPMRWLRFAANMEADPMIRLVYEVTALSGAVIRASCDLRVGLQHVEQLRRTRATTVECVPVEIAP